MKDQIQNKTTQTTVQQASPAPLEVKPKMEFGTIQITAIVGFILVVIVGYILQILWHKRQRFIKASDDFRAAFDDTIHVLETKPFCDRDILNENFRTHEKAMIKFRDNNLKGKRLNSFNKDWQQYEKYCYSRVDVPLVCFLGKERSSIDGPDDSDELDLKHRQKALEHIRRLLSYTKK